MPSPNACLQCGCELPVSSPGGLCAKCLMEMALKQDILAVPPLADGTVSELGSVPFESIGRYQLLQELGEGGCGTVFLAEQQEPVRRRVALKIIKLGMDTRQVVARFEAERQALALMDHPHIAKVLDAGATDNGRPYFVMELVSGRPVTQFCDEHSLDLKKRLELFIQVCHAVQHAHQKGIIHRDLKPSNILVADNDGVALPKVIDFGIAKATAGQALTDKTVFTAFEQFIGTPAYMSPEQAQLSGLDVDTRSDIYSLGVLLYELLTGRTPFEPMRLRQAGFAELSRIIREEEPEKPSTRLSRLDAHQGITLARSRQCDFPKLIGSLRGDLDWIVMKCLEKDRGKRYETSNGLAMDIQRFLRHEPVLASPPSHLNRLQKFARRNRVAIVALSAVSASLIVGLGVATWMFFQERTARAQADLALYKSRLSETRALRLARPQGWSEIAFQNLSNNAALGRKGIDLVDLRSEAVACMQDLDVREIARFPGENQAVWSVDFSEDNAHLATLDYGGALKVWDISRAKLLCENHDTQAGTAQRYSALAPFPAVRFVPGDGSLARTAWDHSVDLFSPTLPSTPVMRITSVSQAQDIALDQRGSTLAVAWSDGRVVAYSRTDQKVIRQIDLKEQGGQERQCVAITPDGSLIAVVGPDHGIDLYTLDPEAPPIHLGRHRGAVSSLCFDSTGTLLASTSDDRTAKVYDVAHRREAFTIFGHKARVKGAAFQPGGHVIATVSDDQTAQLWDSRTGRNLLVIHPGVGPVLTVRFSPDGRRIAVADVPIVLYEVSNQAAKEELVGHSYFITGLAFHPSKPLLASSSADNSIILWNTQSRRPEQRLPGHPRAYPDQLVFSSDGHWLAAGHYAFENFATSDHSIRLWDVTTGKLAAALVGHTNVTPRVAISPAGTLLASGDADGVTILWDIASAKELRRWKESQGGVDSVDFLKTGSLLMVGQVSGQLLLYDCETGVVRAQADIHARPTEIVSLASPSIAAVGGRSRGDIYIFEVPSLRPIRTLSYTHGNGHIRLAFSGDGRLLASAGVDGYAILWDTRTWDMLFKFPLEEAPLGPIAIDSKGLHLAVVDSTEQIKLWNLSLVRQRLEPLRLDW